MSTFLYCITLIQAPAWFDCDCLNILSPATCLLLIKALLVFLEILVPLEFFLRLTKKVNFGNDVLIFFLLPSYPSFFLVSVKGADNS